jgi:hypothetical protein
MTKSIDASEHPQITPAFGRIAALDDSCAQSSSKFEAKAELEILPELLLLCEKPAMPWAKVVSITGAPVPAPEASAPTDDVTKYEQPMPFSRGPYRKAGYGILAQDGSLIATAAVCAESPDNGNLFAGAWEALNMLHEYTSTDKCTDHREGETCRFCVSMNVIRRSMGDPDQQVPLLTWFGRFKEQQTVAGSYKDLYEAHPNKVNQVCHDMQERIFTLESKIDRLRTSAPAQAVALANAVAEISIFKAALEK